MANVKDLLVNGSARVIGTIYGNATSANKLNTNAGSTTQPVYFNNGIPVAITGNIANSTTGNAATATKLQTARTISLTGDITGSTTFDGSIDVSITTVVADDSHNHSNYVKKAGDTMSGILNSSIGARKLGSATVPANFIGNIHLYSSAGSGGAITEGNTNAITFGGSSTSAYAGIYSPSSGSYGNYLMFATTNLYADGAKTRMVIDPSGKTGIGTTSPSYLLHVTGDIYANGGWLRTSGNAGWYNNTYNGGLYMTDSTYIRNYNGKSTRLDNLCLGADNNSYRLYVNGISYFNDNIYLPSTKTIYQNQANDSNYTSIVKWLKGSTNQKDANGNDYAYQPQIGQHNTGGTDGLGSITLLPYATNTEPWGQAVGLYIAKNRVKIDGKNLATEEWTNDNFLNYKWTNGAFDANANTTGDILHVIQNTPTNAAHTNHSILLNIQHIGTPFQIQIPDSSVMYAYKRYYNSTNGWSAWTKMSAGYADSAGNADTVDGYHFSDLEARYLVKSGDTITGNILIAPGGAGGKINGSATNGGLNSILIGDDVWLGDCNVGGTLGLKSNNTASAGFSFFGTDGTNYGRIYYDSSGGHSTSAFYGAVWNDYAEYRESDITEPGRCIIENGDGTLSLSTERLQRGAEVVSDTYGFAIGQTDECNTPIAATGRVLAYTYEPIEEYKTKIGWPVCSGPDGTVSIMTEEEEERYPSRIIGTISEIPSYDEWGTGKVKVNGRVWIRIR